MDRVLTLSVGWAFIVSRTIPETRMGSKNCSLKLSGVIDLTNWCWHVQKSTGFQPKLLACQTANSWSRCSCLMRSLSGFSIIRNVLIYWNIVHKTIPTSTVSPGLFSPGLLEYWNSCVAFRPSWKRNIRAKSFLGLFFEERYLSGSFRKWGLSPTSWLRVCWFGRENAGVNLTQ